MEKQKISVEDLIEVELFEDDDFLKIKETLTRIGISSRKENKLYQSCHILHKRGKYYIVHFKELFALDGLPSNFSDEDKARRNTIVNLLDEWELCEIVNPEKTKDPVLNIKQLKIISHKEKEDWELCPKYHIGKKR
tara:strand:- start:44 stop:451 length:408 start_codon:yes stop_codon:yes gene_type:complete